MPSRRDNTSSAASPHTSEQGQIKKHSLAVFSALFCCCLALFCYIAYAQISFTSHSQARIFGQTLAQQTAGQASEVLVSNDRLSLNLLLRQLSSNPYVGVAAVYNIDNQRIAGQDFGSSNKAYLYSAPIHYQEVIAGHVYLSLNSQLINKPADDALRLIVLSALILFVFSLLIWRAYLNHQHKPLDTLITALTQRDLATLYRMPGDAKEDEFGLLQRLVAELLPQRRQATPAPPEEEIEEEEESSQQATLCVRYGNINALAQCMAETEFRGLLKSQLATLRKACKLHNGRLSFSAEGHAIIVFEARYNDDFLFSSVCCAQLLQKINQQARQLQQPCFSQGLGLSCEDEPNDHQVHPLIFSSASSRALALAAVSLGAKGSLCSDERSDLESDDRIRSQARLENDLLVNVEGIHASYVRLLEQQMEQLSQSKTSA